MPRRFCLCGWGCKRAPFLLTFGRDCLGRRALFFHHGDGFVAFASDLTALLALPFVPRELDERVVASFLVLNPHDRKRTFYRGVERVPSRTMVTIDRARRARHYWSPDFDAPAPYRREEDYVERARELLDQAVMTATADTPRVAISTSGGLDSSAIAATAARFGRAECNYLFLHAAAGISSTSGRAIILTSRTRSRRWRACIRRQH